VCGHLNTFFWLAERFVKRSAKARANKKTKQNSYQSVRLNLSLKKITKELLMQHKIKVYYSYHIFLLANLNEDKSILIYSSLIWIYPLWSRN